VTFVETFKPKRLIRHRSSVLHSALSCSHRILACELLYVEASRPVFGTVDGLKAGLA